MIFREVIIENFGLYKGVHSFDFTPDYQHDNYITLIIGKNGVGKSTIFEAIQLCVLGPFILGERTSASDYESYLVKRAYNGIKGSHEKKLSKIEVSLDYLKAGNTINYRIIRSWELLTKGCKEEINIFENNTALKDLNSKEKNLFIRELISPGYAKVMFFDGERLNNLKENSTLNEFVSDCCQSLFGLNLTYTLERDIESYISKLLLDQKDSHNIAEYNNLEEEVKMLTTDKDELIRRDTELHQELILARQFASNLESEIAEKGRWVTDKIRALDLKRNILENEISNYKKNLVEIYNELGPFAITKSLCIRLEERLKKESKLEKWKNAEEVLKEKIEEVINQFTEAPIWQQLNIANPETEKRLLIEEFKNTIFNETKDISSTSIVHDFSDAQRHTLLSWINKIIDQLPTQISELTIKLSINEAKLQELIKEKSTFTREDAIKSLLESHQKIHNKIGAIENEIKSNLHKTNDLDNKITFYSSRRDSAYKKILNQEDIDRKIKLYVFKTICTSMI